MSILLVGNPSPEHVGAHLLRAALDLRIPVECMDLRAAYTGPALARKANWWLRGRRPNRLEAFSAEVVAAIRKLAPAVLIATGQAPLHAGALEDIRRTGTQTINFLTDDPWNPAHRAPWFLEALPLYDRVFSPRTANMDDLRALGCSQVSYLPFAFARHLHYPESEPSFAGQSWLSSDVFFAGGADRDRLQWIVPLTRRGYSLALYGAYWQRHRQTRRWARGIAGPETLRKAVAAGKVSLCLVRSANRDGHAMRSFELPAMGACMLAERTADHAALFGDEGDAVLYFETLPEMLAKLDRLLGDAGARRRLSEAAYRRIVLGRHTYHDRLAAMLAACGQASPVA